MFTGIVHDLGTLEEIKPLALGAEWRVSCPEHITQALQQGDSIALNGACTTALNIKPGVFSVQLLQETLDKTHFGHAKPGNPLNLELCLTPTSFMGGHWVSGHIDGVGQVVTFQRQANSEFWIITIRYDPKFKRYLIPKGSITLNGISLTVVDLEDDACVFSCHLIPHTVTSTMMRILSPGDDVNLEFDMVGKYLHRISQFT